MNDFALAGAGALLSFLVGAATSAVMVNYARRHQLHGEYAFRLLLEAFLLLGFGVLGVRLSAINGLFVPVTVMLLCFIMGLQNAVITKVSAMEIRTTHVTGMITDIGIELGKLFYWNGKDSTQNPRVLANRDRLGFLSLMVTAFFIGGITGAFGFRYLGYLSTVPLALILIALAVVPAVDDVVRLVQQRKQS